MAATASARADYARATDELANRVRSAVQDRAHAGLLTDHVSQAEDTQAALAAVRVLGLDAVSAPLLNNAALTDGDGEILVDSLRVFPPAFSSPARGDDTVDGSDAVLAWRDWALGQMAPRLQIQLDCPVEPIAPDTSTDSWRSSSARMAQLSTLAVPGLDSTVHDLARQDPLSIARGATRAILRRDHPTAAALGRWLALLHHGGTALPLNVELLVEHISLFGSGDPRTALDTAIALELLRGGAG